jgi:DNA-binding response OmpR family regulator
MMPKLDGFQVCREIRRESDVPIIMITARGEDFEKIMGLEIGNSTHQRGDAPH